jgi:Flp pilus assembly protein TadD
MKTSNTQSKHHVASGLAIVLAAMSLGLTGCDTQTQTSKSTTTKKTETPTETKKTTTSTEKTTETTPKSPN